LGFAELEEGGEAEELDCEKLPEGVVLEYEEDWADRVEEEGVFDVRDEDPVVEDRVELELVFREPEPAFCIEPLPDLEPTFCVVILNVTGMPESSEDAAATSGFSKTAIESFEIVPSAGLY
jgi:hypothetical protein